MQNKRVWKVPQKKILVKSRWNLKLDQPKDALQLTLKYPVPPNLLCSTEKFIKEKESNKAFKIGPNRASNSHLQISESRRRTTTITRRNLQLPRRIGSIILALISQSHQILTLNCCLRTPIKFGSLSRVLWNNKRLISLKELVDLQR